MKFGITPYRKEINCGYLRKSAEENIWTLKRGINRRLEKCSL
jgi:hypothetical protein